MVGYRPGQPTYGELGWSVGVGRKENRLGTTARAATVRMGGRARSSQRRRLAKSQNRRGWGMGCDRPRTQSKLKRRRLQAQASSRRDRRMHADYEGLLLMMQQSTRGWTNWRRPRATIVTTSVGMMRFGQRCCSRHRQGWDSLAPVLGCVPIVAGWSAASRVMVLGNVTAHNPNSELVTPVGDGQLLLVPSHQLESGAMRRLYS